MSSPYKPPDAPVADPPTPPIKLGRRPWPISAASILLTLVIANECVRLTSGSNYVIAVSLFWIVVLSIIALLLERGRNWARWLLFILTALSSISLAAAWFVPTPAGAKLLPDVAHAVRSLGAELCLIAATTLVFAPGRAWFQRS